MNNKKEQLHLSLPPSLKERLAAAAKQDRSSMNRFVILAIETACTKAEEKTNKPLEDRKNV